MKQSVRKVVEGILEVQNYVRLTDETDGSNIGWQRLDEEVVEEIIDLQTKVVIRREEAIRFQDNAIYWWKLDLGEFLSMLEEDLDNEQMVELAKRGLCRETENWYEWNI